MEIEIRIARITCLWIVCAIGLIYFSGKNNRIEIGIQIAKITCLWIVL